MTPPAGSGRRTSIQVGFTRTLSVWARYRSDFTLDHCYFGEHLLKKYPSRDVALVESEKSAVIASITAGIFPDLIWVACGGRMNFKIEKLACVRERRIYVYPDADSYEKWKVIASDAVKSGFRIQVSDLIERNATSEEKANGFDLADYLIRELQKRNEYNAYVDHYNAALEIVLADRTMIDAVNAILDEQIAVMTFDGCIAEDNAEQLVCVAENLRRVVLEVAVASCRSPLTVARLTTTMETATLMNSAVCFSNSQ
ncbi:MAG: hypothetical protein IPJ30_12035 [Acidobacteria bacterium]|nr:hypothetical protein [Acidobacteriota bacterium]